MTKIPFLADLEKLITEHGSAVILKERIALERDRFEALERKYETAREDLDALRAKCADQKIKILELTGENAALQDQLEAATGSAELDDDEKKALTVLAKIGGSQLIAASVSQQSGLSELKTINTLDRLIRRGFAEKNTVIVNNSPRRFNVTSEGLDLALKLGLVA